MSIALLLSLIILALFTGLSSSTVFNLKVEIDAASLEEIYNAGQAVVVVKGGAGNGWYSIWSSFEPFENNYLSWNDTEGYYVFVSQSPLKDLTPVFVGSWERSSSGLVYPFHLGSFGNPYPEYWVGENQVGLINNNSYAFLFGLAQDIQVNSKWYFKVPVSVAELLPLEHDVLPLVDSVYIFLAPNTLLSSVLSSDLETVSNSQVTLIPFSSTSSNYVAQWERDTASFLISVAG